MKLHEKSNSRFLCSMFFFQPMALVTLRVLVRVVPRVPNLSHLLHHTPTARNTGGKRAQASRSQMVYLQELKVQHYHIYQTLRNKIRKMLQPTNVSFAPLLSLLYFFTEKKYSLQIAYNYQKKLTSVIMSMFKTPGLGPSLRKF